MITNKPYTWINVSAQAFDHNVACVKKLVGPECAIALVIKANAYGHGTSAMAQLAQQRPDITWCYTATLAEALEVRRAGFTKSLLAATVLDQDPRQAIVHDIALSAYNNESLAALDAAGAMLGKKVKVHLKIDTGLSRFGFLPDQISSLLTMLAQFPWLTIDGLFTHFASAENKQEFTTQQYTLFEEVVSQFKACGYNVPWIHCNNSAATVRQYPFRYNIARVGAALYGIWPAPWSEHGEYIGALTPILTWQTCISAIKTVPTGSFIGYQGTHHVLQDARIAVLPIGYFEGYDRRLANKGQVIVHGQSSKTEAIASVVGRVCMNQIMIDVTHIHDAQVGDTVTLLGAQQPVHASTIAELVEAGNPREIVTSLHASVPRVLENTGDNALEQTYRPSLRHAADRGFGGQSKAEGVPT